MRPLRVAGRVRLRVLRNRETVDLRAEDRLAVQLAHLVLGGAVVLVRGVVVDDPDRARLVEVEAEVIGHLAVALRNTAADPLVTDLAVVHRLLREALLCDRRGGRRRLCDHSDVAVPLDGRRTLWIVRPVREAVGLPCRIRSEPGEPDRAGRSSLRPDELVRDSRRRVDLDGRRPALALVAGRRVVDVVVVRVDPRGVDVPTLVDRQRREEVAGAAATR